MNINYVKGNVFDTRDNMVIHIVNTEGVMTSGLGRKIRDTKEYQHAYDAYRSTFLEQGSLELGTLSYSESKTLTIVNMVAQTKSAGPNGNESGVSLVDLEALKTALVKTRTLIRKGRKILDKYDYFYPHIQYDSISMPLIGTGAGGEKWENIEPLLVEIFGNEVELNICYLPESEHIISSLSPNGVITNSKGEQIEFTRVFKLVDEIALV